MFGCGRRFWNTAAFFSCTVLIAVAFYFQFILGLEPCPLCIMQRMVVLLLAVIFFIGIWLANPKANKIHASIASLFSLLGICISARQVYLQNLPLDAQPACGPGLNYMIAHFPVSETLKALFLGTGDCGHIQWVFLHLSIPAWMLLIFTGYLLFSLSLFRKK